MTVEPREPAWTGAVLVGGTSRRMGRDKALVDVGGPPLVALVARALAAAGAAEVLAVGARAALAPTLDAEGVLGVPDDHPGEGPLGGILTALRVATHDMVVVLACDLPGVSADAIAIVLAALVAHPEAEAVAPVRHGRVEGLHAAWRRSARVRLAHVFAAGERRVAAGLDAVQAVRLDGLPAAWLEDADTPGDVARHLGGP